MSSKVQETLAHLLSLATDLCKSQWCAYIYSYLKHLVMRLSNDSNMIV